MKARVASAPCSFGVFETNIDEDVHPDPARLLRVMADCGYTGTELGPPGYLGSGREVAALLSTAGLTLAGSFLPCRFSRAEEFSEDLAVTDAALAELVEAAGDNDLPMVLLSDAFVEPDRMRFAGRIEQHPETWLSPERSKLLLDNLHRAAELCKNRGFDCSLHFHSGTYIETSGEIAAVVGAMDTSLLGICFDTGHAAFGGSDPLTLLRTYGEMVNHVHLKDVDRTLLKEVHAGGEGLDAAWDKGVFCELGRGDAEVAECIAELERLDYGGWLIVEQDRPLSASWTFDDAARAQRENRDWLAQRGL